MEKPQTKPSRQIEFCNYMATLEIAGIKPAEIARRMGVSPGALSQYKSGQTNPGTDKIVSIRRIVEDLQQSIGKISETTIAKVHSQIDDLAMHDREGFEAAKINIGIIHARMDKSPTTKIKNTTSSKPVSAAAELLDVADELECAAPSPRRKP